MPHRGEVDPRSIALHAVTLAMAAVILLPLAAAIMPAIYFDVDPRSETGRQAVISLGPTGAAWWHVLGVLVAAAAMSVHRWLGGRIRWGACALAGVGILFCAWQMPGHFENRLHGGAWIAAVSLALAAAHLARHEPARRWLVAALVAMLVPLLLDALWYVLVTHPQTVEQYEHDTVGVLEAHGFEPGSSQHLAYEDRLRATHATGPFGMSNVFGTVAAALTVLGAGLAAALWRRARPWAIAAATVGIGGLLTTSLTESRGALLALPMGLAVVALAWGLRNHVRWHWSVPTLAVLLVVLAFGAVLGRAAIGPPDTHEGERSLLFRAHYWEGAARMIGEHLPQSALQGMGVAGFRAEYLRFKNPISPESVTSTHNVFIDHITMIGVGGLAWSALLLLWLWQAGRGAVGAMRAEREEAETDADANSALTRGQLALAAAPAVVVFGTQYLLELPTMVIESALLWLGGALAFIGLAGGFALPARARRTGLAAGLFGAAVVLLVHNQIEMSFLQVGSSVTLWVVIGLAAGAATPAGETEAASIEAPVADARANWLPAGGLLAVAVLVIALAAAPITAHQRHMAAAAEALQADRYPRAIASLDAAGQAMPREDRALRWRVRLRMEIAQALVNHHRPDTAAAYLAEAAQIVAEAEALALPGPQVARQRAGIEEAAAMLLDQPERLHDAIAATQRVVERTPYNLNDRINLGDLYWRTNQRDKAIEQYRAARRISDAYYLEPLQQLTADQREHIERRMREAGAEHRSDQSD